MAADQPETFFPFERPADALRQREFARLADVIPLTLEALRSLTPGAFRTEVALTLERLGYAVINDPRVADLIVTRDGGKYIVACARPGDIAPTQTRDLARLHAAVVNANADAGFYITTRLFTRAAEAYAATAPIRLVNGKQLSVWMKQSREGVALPETYQAMCRQCGDIVEHRLDRAEALPCGNGHPVAPTIAWASLFRERETAGDDTDRGSPRRSHSIGHGLNRRHRRQSVHRRRAVRLKPRRY